MQTGMLHTHYLVVTLFLVIYLVKTALLLTNKKEALAKFTKAFKIPEMIISVLFLGTGIYLLTTLPSINMLMVIKLSLVFLSIPLAIIGFKKGNKGLAVLSFLMIVGSFGLAEVHHKKMGGGGNTTGNFSADKYYNDVCSKCHGADGKAGIAGAKDLSVSTMSHADVVKAILEGKGAMPKNAELSPEQADAVAKYAESLRGK